MGIKEIIEEKALIIVNIGIGVGIAYTFLELWPKENLGYSKWIPVGCLAIAIYVFNTQFLHKSEAGKTEIAELGPTENFIKSNASWQWGKDGVPEMTMPPPPKDEKSWKPRWKQ